MGKGLGQGLHMYGRIQDDIYPSEKAEDEKGQGQSSYDYFYVTFHIFAL
jgi:hypothetical protein